LTRQHKLTGPEWSASLLHRLRKRLGHPLRDILVNPDHQTELAEDVINEQDALEGCLPSRPVPQRLLHLAAGFVPVLHFMTPSSLILTTTSS